MASKRAEAVVKEVRRKRKDLDKKYQESEGIMYAPATFDVLHKDAPGPSKCNPLLN